MPSRLLAEKSVHESPRAAPIRLVPTNREGGIELERSRFRIEVVVRRRSDVPRPFFVARVGASNFDVCAERPLLGISLSNRLDDLGHEFIDLLWCAADKLPGIKQGRYIDLRKRGVRAQP